MLKANHKITPEGYFHRLLHKLGFSMLFSMVIMTICVMFMDVIVSPLGVWFKDNISANEKTFTKAIIIMFFTFSMIVFIISYLWMSMRRSSYIRKIVKAMEEVSKGNLEVRVPENGHDELTFLAASLNSLIDDVSVLIEREKQQDERKQEFITQIAHDLRTPLTSVMGYLKLIEKDVEMDPDQERRYLGVAVRKAEQLQNLVEELFTYMKLCDEAFPLNKAAVDLITLIEQVMDEQYPIFEKNEIECTLDTAVNSLVVEADGALLARLFDNLLNNAIKYGKEGKKIIISVSETQDDIIISVTNFGKAIAEDEIARVFEKFYRTDHSRSSSTGGTGLGLAIADNIVRLHGGRISCKSSEENGTSFIVNFPQNLRK